VSEDEVVFQSWMITVSVGSGGWEMSVDTMAVWTRRCKARRTWCRREVSDSDTLPSEIRTTGRGLL